MGSVWVCSFPSCTTFLCRNCNFSPTHLLQPSTSVSFLRAGSSQTNTTAARTRTRKSRSIKSDTEICNDIQEFLASVGFPHDHIPSTKELLQHGWNDLAKIVRRRGHKQIQEILTRNSLNADVDILSAETSLDERLDAANDFQDPLTGQNEKVESVVDDVEASAEFLLGSSPGGVYVDSSSSLGEATNSAEEASTNLFVEDGLREVKDDAEVVDNVTEGNFYPTEEIIVDNDYDNSREDLYPNFSSQSSIIPTEISGDSSSSFGEGTNSAEEASANLFVEDGLREVKDHAEVVENVTEGNFYPTEVIIVDNDYDSSSEDLYPNFGRQISIIPTEISGELPFQTVSSGNSESEDSLVSKTVGETLSLTENLSNTSFNESNLDIEDKEFSHVEPLVGFPLEQKDLGALEGLDDSNDDVAEDVATTSEVAIREHLSGDERLDSVVYSADTDSSSTNLDTLANLSLKEKVANFIQNGELDLFEGTHLPEDNNVMAHGNSLTSKQAVPSRALNLDPPLWDVHLPDEDLTTHSNKDVDTEASEVQNENEINQLKFMLHQKELELSRLKEQIEKEKVTLSLLQTKAEAEISKARKLISEKDAELDVAEESLLGLKEVQVEFCGDGDVVEVAGSFNGWHDRIKLDPQQSISTIDLNASRSSKCWSTMLWLYPGVYEIKFVVDGKWKTDPQRESVTRGHICNNILRVK